jgi:hypothetical protein
VAPGLHETTEARLAVILSGATSTTVLQLQVIEEKARHGPFLPPVKVARKLSQSRRAPALP